MSIFEGIKTMFSGSGSDTANWNAVEKGSEVDRIIEQSYQQPQLLYKHSNRCSVCWFAKSELEKVAEAIKAKAEMHFVDVIKSREVSNYIADKLGIRHESPQAILVNGGEVVWHDSHGTINSATILDVLG